MAYLSLSVLGVPRITIDGQTVTGFRYDKVRALFLYLAVEAQRAHTRDELAALLWPEESQLTARTSLRQAIGHLRQAVGPEGEQPFLLITPTTLQFNQASEVEFDLAAFTVLLDTCDMHRRATNCVSCARRLSAATALYRRA